MNTRTEPIHSEADKNLQQEFNEWAAAGRGDEMESHHSDITDQTLALMDLKSTDRVLDLGCGTGWASRRIARVVRDGEVVGIDVADEMLRRAEAASTFANVRYLWGSAQGLPLPDNHFSKVLSVESFYYYADQGAALDELRRVMAPGGRLFILINLYKDNHYSLRWVGQLKVPVQALSEAEYIALLQKHGFVDVEARRIPDRSPTPETYSGKWFKDAEELRDFKRIGALLLIAGKPR
jgi:ubiquinone/menaquinone biosynthesis C-methylase UbiE